MKEGIQIKSGGIEIIDAIESLWEELKTHHLGVDHIYPNGIAKAEFQKRKKELTDKGKLLLIELAQTSKDRKIIGYCLSTITESNIGELDSIFIDSRYRRCGIGSELVQRALDWMDACGVETKKVNVLQINEEATALYSRFGFKTRQLEMVIPQSTEPGSGGNG